MGKKKAKGAAAPEKKGTQADDTGLCAAFDGAERCGAPREPGSAYCADHFVPGRPAKDGKRRCEHMEVDGRCKQPAEKGLDFCDGHKLLHVGAEPSKADDVDPRKSRQYVDPFPRKLTRDVKVDLSVSEREKLVEEFTELLDNQKSLREEAKEMADSYKNRLGALEERVRELGGAIRKRYTMRTVDVEERRNDGAGSIETVRLDTKQVIDTRAQTLEERQARLPGVTP